MEIKAFTLPNGGVAAEYTRPDGIEVQVVGLKTNVLLGTRLRGGKWNVTTVTEPSRFGKFDTVKAIRAWAKAFADEAGVNA